jgi:muramoyltetrapeptide carboxypeptidase
MGETLLKSHSLGQATLPPPLQPGERLMVIAPSGALREMESFKQGIEIWRSWGFEVDLHPAFSERWGYLAGTDMVRRQQLADALQNDRYRGIICARGGYGGTRLLEGWQWPQPMSPKWLIGFSDITSLLWSLAKEGIAGVHGPLLTTLGNEPDWSQQRLRDLVTGKSLPPIDGETWVSGQATGILLPANLTVATCLLGTPHEPALDGVILAFEDVTEAPYRIDRMLTHWRMMGQLEPGQGHRPGALQPLRAARRGTQFFCRGGAARSHHRPQHSQLLRTCPSATMVTMQPLCP